MRQYISSKETYHYYKMQASNQRLQKHFYFKSVFKEYDLSNVLLGPLQMKGEKWINNKEHTD